jgi:hypothetical protein
MNKATRRTVSLVGVYAGLLGMAHGIFSLQQGNVPINGILFEAIGPPCQAETVYHACFPALTFLPNLFISGFLALLVGLVMVVWSAAFVQRKWGGLVLLILSLILLAVGGGFIPAFTGIIAGVAGTRINAPLGWWRERLIDRRLQVMAGLWPWSLLVYFLWLLGQLLLGMLANNFMMSLEGVALPLEMLLLLLAIFTAYAADIAHMKNEE